MLYRLGAAGVVVAGPVHRERIEAALAGLGGEDRIVRIPIESDTLESPAS